MSRLSRHRREIFWLGLLLGIGLLGLVEGPTRDDGGTDTWSTGPDGKRVFFTLAQRLLGDVRRHSERLEPPEAAGTLCILGPARYPDAAEWRRLREWVLAGHTLVFAARHDDPAVQLPFGLRVRTGSETGSGSDAESAAKPEAALEVDEVLRENASGPIPWGSPAWIEGAAPDAWVAARRGGRPLIVSQSAGKGGSRGPRLR